ncbi:hypothetical protein LJC59_03155, partial [Desulfovibrio sp. OttesenSCG-928-A18]|nr:hypothetical protein [Desulfovibrio sp. OttesenSCG-928-A18]
QLMAYAFALSDKETAFNKLAVNMQPALACMRARAAELEQQERDKAAAKAAKDKAAARRQSAGAEPVSGAARAKDGALESDTGAAAASDAGSADGAFAARGGRA